MFGRFKLWLRNDRGATAIEAGMLMPVMLTILMGIIDLGVGVLTDQKVINSSQMVGDLLGRMDSVSTADLNDAIEAGRLALEPYDTTSMGFDVAGIQFIGSSTNPTVVWRDTVNMTANSAILVKASGLGNDLDGVFGVTVRYVYTPYFSSLITGSIEMVEVSYVRARNGLFIPRV